jgi:hypothetical protein
MKTTPNPLRQIISAKRLLEEAEAVRKRVSGYSHEKRMELLAAARATINGRTSKKAVRH